VIKQDWMGMRGALTPPKKRLKFIPGKMILRIRETAVRPCLGSASLKIQASEARLLPETLARPLEYLRNNAGLKDVVPIFSARRMNILRSAVSGVNRAKISMLSSVADSVSEQLAGISVASLDPKKVTPKLINQIGASSGVEFAEPMPARWLAAVKADPKQNLQWGLRAINWFEADLPDASQIRVAVLDTGIDKNHPDFKGLGLVYHHDGLKAQDIVGHGTHVAGIIAARANNGIGIAGVADCQLCVWKIFPDAPAYGDFYVDGERYLQALNAVVDEQVKIVNLSLGGTASSTTEEILFRRLDEKGIVVVAAMGNEYRDGSPTEYPAAYPNVFAVGSIAENRKRSDFSNTGKHIQMVAPGSNILSTVPMRSSAYRDETEYVSWSGTSMATPHVAGAAALIAAKYPGMSAQEIKKRLRETAKKLPAMNKRDQTSSYGCGLLDLKKAL